MTPGLTGKKFWSWNEYRFEDISVRGEGYTFEIYTLKPEMSSYFKNPPNSFFQKYPTDTYSKIKWKQTPIENNELEKLEFVTPLYGNWSNKTRKEIGIKQDIVRQLAMQSGSLYVFDTILRKDVTLYLIAPDRNLILYINHNM